MDRSSYSSGTKWETLAGYSRAVRVGDLIAVSGTTATGQDGQIQAVGDARSQTELCIDNIETALQQLGSGLSDVVRTRIYVSDITHWQAIAEVHGERFGSIRPATSLVEVSGFVDPAILVEIEADAVLTAG